VTHPEGLLVVQSRCWRLGGTAQTSSGDAIRDQFNPRSSNSDQGLTLGKNVMSVYLLVLTLFLS
jgi:hypothetical protein